MNRSLFTAPRMLVAAVVLLLISSLCPPDIAAALSGPPQHLLDTILGLGTAPLHRVGSALRGHEPQDVAAGQSQDNFLALAQENASLRLELQRLRGQLQQARVAVDDPNVKQRFVNVSGTSTRGGFPVLTVYHDSGDGVTSGMVVVSPYGQGFGSCLVGRVSDVSARTATVELITARRTRLHVVIAPAKAGTNRLLSDPMQILVQAGGTFVTMVKAPTSIMVGDLAFLADPRGWPNEAQGRIVGKVVRVEPDRKDPMGFRTVTIEPIYDLTVLTQVAVLIPGNPAAASR